MRALLDDPAAALQFLHSVARDPSTEPQVRNGLSAWLAYHGDAAGALEALRAARKLQLGTGGGSLWSAVFRDVRKLPGFKQFVRDLGLVEIWRKTGRGDYCKPAGTDDFECH
jgi:hypothetical protein